MVMSVKLKWFLNWKQAHWKFQWVMMFHHTHNVGTICEPYGTIMNIL